MKSFFQQSLFYLLSISITIQPVYFSPAQAQTEEDQSQNPFSSVLPPLEKRYPLLFDVQEIEKTLPGATILSNSEPSENTSLISLFGKDETPAPKEAWVDEEIAPSGTAIIKSLPADCDEHYSLEYETIDYMICSVAGYVESYNENFGRSEEIEIGDRTTDAEIDTNMWKMLGRYNQLNDPTNLSLEDEMTFLNLQKDAQGHAKLLINKVGNHGYLGADWIGGLQGWHGDNRNFNELLTALMIVYITDPQRRDALFQLFEILDSYVHMDIAMAPNGVQPHEWSQVAADTAAWIVPALIAGTMVMVGGVKLAGKAAASTARVGGRAAVGTGRFVLRPARKGLELLSRRKAFQSVTTRFANQPSFRVQMAQSKLGRLQMGTWFKNQSFSRFMENNLVTKPFFNFFHGLFHNPVGAWVNQGRFRGPVWRGFKKYFGRLSLGFLTGAGIGLAWTDHKRTTYGQKMRPFTVLKNAHAKIIFELTHQIQELRNQIEREEQTLHDRIAFIQQSEGQIYGSETESDEQVLALADELEQIRSRVRAWREEMIPLWMQLPHLARTSRYFDGNIPLDSVDLANDDLMTINFEERSHVSSRLLINLAGDAHNTIKALQLQIDGTYAVMRQHHLFRFQSSGVFLEEQLSNQD